MEHFEKYDYDKALNKLRAVQYKVTMQLRQLEAAEFDEDGDLIKFTDTIPLTPAQERIMWEYL